MIVNGICFDFIIAELLCSSHMETTIIKKNRCSKAADGMKNRLSFTMIQAVSESEEMSHKKLVKEL